MSNEAFTGFIQQNRKGNVQFYSEPIIDCFKDGACVSVMEERVGDNGFIQAGRTNGLGQPFENLVAVSGAAQKEIPLAFPRISCVDPNYCLAVWKENDEAFLRTARTLDRGATWEPVVTIPIAQSEGRKKMADVACFFPPRETSTGSDAFTCIVAFFFLPTGDSFTRKYFARSTNGGAAFFANDIVKVGGDDGLHIRLDCSERGETCLAVYGNTVIDNTNYRRLETMVSWDQGRSWATPVNPPLSARSISRGASAVTFPVVGCVNPQICVAVTDVRHGTEGWLEVTRTTDAGRTWSQLQVLYSPTRSQVRAVEPALSCRRDLCVCTFHFEGDGTNAHPPLSTYSRDGGVTWSTATPFTGVPQPSPPRNSFMYSDSDVVCVDAGCIAAFEARGFRGEIDTSVDTVAYGILNLPAPTPPPVSAPTSAPTSTPSKAPSKTPSFTPSYAPTLEGETRAPMANVEWSTKSPSSLPAKTPSPTKFEFALPPSEKSQDEGDGGLGVGPLLSILVAGAFLGFFLFAVIRHKRRTRASFRDMLLPSSMKSSKSLVGDPPRGYSAESKMPENPSLASSKSTSSSLDNYVWVKNFTLRPVTRSFSNQSIPDV